MDLSYCRSLLLDELAQRQTKNSIYSLRAFARDLGIGSTSLSDFFAGKRNLSKTSISKVACNLGLSPLAKQQLYGTVSAGPSDETSERVLLEEDAFRLIADWYYLAILNLAKIQANKATKSWVADRLGITETQAQMGLERLARLGFIKVHKNCIVRTAKPISTTREVVSRAIQKHHAGHLKLAAATLQEVPVEMREFSSVTMAINTKNLPAAKEILMKTKRRVEKVLESGVADEVYNLSFQLYPLSHSDKTRKG